jgi:dimethylamine/trimethylamine dehydrogenase
MGYVLPKTLAEMRRIKAKGRWGVVNTEHCSVHPSSDDGPAAFCTLWDEDDMVDQALITEAVHEYDALARIELWHGGMHTPNRYSRMTPLSFLGEPLDVLAPLQLRAIDRTHIRNLRRWHVDAAKRARRAGFDIEEV